MDSPYAEISLLPRSCTKNILVFLGVLRGQRKRLRDTGYLSNIGDAVHVLVISADLPVMQKTWCGNAGVERLQTVSDHIDMDFALKYGTYVKGRRFHYRAVFVVGKDDKMVYAAYMPGLDVEPNYDEVLAAVRAV